jgi:parallel beta-helix repeat protein
MLTLIFNIQSAKAESGTIYIRADGSVEPSTAPISSINNVTYTFTGNIYDEIVVERNNIVVDGAGYTVEGLGTGYGIRLEGRSNVTIRNTTIKNFIYGIWLYESSNNSIVGNNIKNNGDDGIALYSSNYNNISGNNITANNRYGIVIESSNYNSISGNSITANGYCGIALRYSSSYNSISGNNIKNNRYGIWLEGLNNCIIGNTIANNRECGIWLSSSNNIIHGNNIKNNTYGIGLSRSSNNRIYHNNFINNTYQVYSYYSVNVWDDSYPSGGNYWSDYTDADLYCGPNQDKPGSDGIGDTPYIIDADNRDRYPLMNPYGAPPPPTYNLTIMATAGGTTNPAPGTYSYTANLSVQVTAIPDAGYLFDCWELDSVNVGSANPYTVLMDKNHTLKAFFSPIPPPLSASISPLSASILVGQSVTFTSTVSGGYTPYTYQWHLNGAPVSGATSNAWIFTPIADGIFYVYLKVTDAKGNTAQSEAARILVSAVPVGGYSISIKAPTKTEPILPYIALMATLTITITKMRNKTERRH